MLLIILYLISSFAEDIMNEEESKVTPHNIESRGADYAAPAKDVIDLHSKEFCVDVSTYQPVVWEEREEEECATTFVKRCEDKTENVCDDVTETRCEVIPYTECSMSLEPHQFKETKLSPKKFVEKACTHGKQTIPHKKLLPECRNVTKQNCVTVLEKDQYGRKVSAGSEGCEPVSWQECKLVAKDVHFIIPLVTCSDKQELWYHQHESQTQTVATNKLGCQVKSSTHCTSYTRPDCRQITWNECSEVPESKCTQRKVHVPTQELLHQKKCLLPDVKPPEWGSWSTCSKSCDGGTRRRSRGENTNSRGEKEPTQYVPVYNKEEVEECNPQGCTLGEVCPQEDQMDPLTRNASMIREENEKTLNIIRDMIKENKFSWVAGKTSLQDSSCSEVQAYRQGEIPPTREERMQGQVARRDFLDSLERKRKENEGKYYFPSPLEVFTTDANNQGECSSCSAFAVTAALETCVAKVVPNPSFSIVPPRGLSSQNMLDCAFGFRNHSLFGCDGGQSFRYLEWLLEEGILDTNRQYPYLDSALRLEGFNNSYRMCYQSGVRPAAVMDVFHRSWNGHSDRDLENILLDGHAIITTMEVQGELMYYKSGVYQSARCQDWKLGDQRDFQWDKENGFRPLRHAVVIVGFGEEKGQKYWKVKNSWGENWGSSGFFKIIRNGSAHCGLGAYFSVAICKACITEEDCQNRSPGLAQSQRAPPNLPEEGIAGGFTSFLSSPFGGVGLATCLTCSASIASCPPLSPCRTKAGKCCPLVRNRGYRLYCPSRC